MADHVDNGTKRGVRPGKARGSKVTLRSFASYLVKQQKDMPSSSKHHSRHLIITILVHSVCCNAPCATECNAQSNRILSTSSVVQTNA
eukprot:993367-Amphidinium_carterae.2